MTEVQSPEILLIRHLPDLEEANRYLKAVLEPKFTSHLADRIENWRSSRNWGGAADPGLKQALWVAPPYWQTEGGGANDYDYWFTLSTLKGRAGADISPLSSFIGASAGGLRQALIFDRYEGKGQDDWKRMLQSSTDQLQSLVEAGFEIDARSGIIAYPVRLAPEALGQALAEDDFAEAFRPLEQALSKIEATLPVFDALIATLQGHVGSIAD